MADTIIIQRVLPHYREKLFERIYERLGWKTVIASNPPTETFLELRANSRSHIVTLPFEFRSDGDAYACSFPLRQIIEELEPRRIISEFSLKIDSWYRLPWFRATSKIASYALWSHGWNMERGLETAVDKIYQHARLLPLLPADMLLTYSSEGREWLDRKMPWKRTLDLGNTIDIQPIRAAAARSVPVHFGAPQFLSIGRLKKDKQFDALIRIFGKLKNVFPNAALTIIGDGPERDTLEKLRDSMGLSNVRLVGAIYDEEEIAKHCVGADAFVLPGAAGLSVNHALAYHLPVIAFTRGRGMPHHHPEIVYVKHGVSGLLCENAGEDEMASFIAANFLNGTLDKIRENLPTFVERELTIDRVVERFVLADQLF